MIRAMITVPMAAFLLVTNLAQATAQNVVVGVRADAPPFSSHNLVDDLPVGNGAPNALGYTGFMVDLCGRVLARLASRHGFNIETKVVDAADRFERLATGDIHILCDPATILSDRLRTAMASVPVYMSAVTFAQPEPLPQTVPCMTLVGYVSETTAAAGVQRIFDRGAWPRYGWRIGPALDELNAGRPSPMTQATEGTCNRARIQRFPTHIDLATEFCNGNVLFYVGDVEIVRASIARHDGCMDRITVRPATYGEERYAIYTALPQDGVPTEALMQFHAELARQVHGLPGASGDSPLVKLYEDRGGTRHASEKLTTFFWALTGDYPGR